MLYRIFTLHPTIFDSFLDTSLIARGLSKSIIQAERVNWREEFGLGNYRQVDDRPFGGGTGMVLRCEPVFAALEKHQAVSRLFRPPLEPTPHARILPNNSQFFQMWNQARTGSENSGAFTKVTVSLTPRGFPVNQQIVEWLSDFQEINILCGRYEGFDARVSEAVDLELSLGDFVLNGGEVAAMALIEGVSRLLPDFVTKGESVRHESFSLVPNEYSEQKEYVIGKKKLQHKGLKEAFKLDWLDEKQNLFDDQWWLSKVMPRIEHPQYTRPEAWQGWQVPQVLLEGNHKLIQEWRHRWWTN